MSIWLLAESDDNRHPDLHEAEHLYGVAHTTGGRYLPRFIYGATPEEQEARLADPAGWSHHVAFPPSQMAVDGARQYAAARGLPDPHDVSYEHVMQDPETIRQTGRDYDAMPAHDPAAVPHYDAFAREVNDQYHHMTNNMGINVQAVDHDPYPDVHHMMNDVDTNKRLQVMGSHVTGGHPHLSDDDNDKFRAVHDFFGHAATGRSFDRHGEQAAYLAHSKMFSPQARPALASETKGQNASLILNGQFPQQKVGILPEFKQMPKSAARPDAQWGADAMRFLDKNPEGITVRQHPGDAPSSGFMVSHPGEEEISRSRLDPHSMRDFVEEHGDQIEEPDNYYGGWSAPRTQKPEQPGWYHDVSKNVQDPRDAAEMALRNKQQAVYDLDHDEEVSTPEMVNRATSPGIHARRWYW